MGKIMVFEEHIMSVHDDYDPWASMGVGLNDNRQLVVTMRYDNYGGMGSPRYGFEKRIVLSQKGTDILIDKLHTTLTRLPKAFSSEFSHGHRWDDASVSEVFDTFNEIRNYLECLKIHYTIEKEES